MIYTICAGWNDGETSLKLATDDLEKAKSEFLERALSKDGDPYLIIFSAWSCEREAEYVYGCESRTFWVGTSVECFDIETFLEGVSDRLVEQAKKRELEDKITSLEKQLEETRKQLKKIG